MLLRIEGRQLAEEFADAQFCKGMVLVHVPKPSATMYIVRPMTPFS